MEETLMASTRELKEGQEVFWVQLQVELHSVK